MLVFMFDRGGIDVIPPKKYVPKNGEIPLDVVYEEIEFAKPNSMAALLAKPTQPKVTCIDYTLSMPTDMSLDYMPSKSTAAMEDFVKDYNQLSARVRAGQGLPWVTGVFDSMTGYQDVVLNHLSSFNPGALQDARQWAAQVGGKVRQLVLSATSFPWHVIFLFHTQPPEADEQTKILLELPNIYSKVKGVIGGLFSQYFYAYRANGKPMISQMDIAYVKGLGSRWPQGLPAQMAPDFKTIYGGEL